MPFTPTHALAAIPLARARSLTPSALAIGTMTPDLWAFMPGAPQYSTAHSWLWGPVSGLPYGLLAFVLFRLCRGPAIGFASEAARRKLAPYVAHELSMSAPRWASVALSIVLGIWTHVLWDSFTHRTELATALAPGLLNEWLSLSGRSLPGYKVLQLACSALGLPLLAWWIARWYARLPSTGAHVEAASTAQRGLALALLIGAPIAVLLGGWTVMLAERRPLELITRHVVTGTIALYVIGAVALTLPSRLRASLSAGAGSPRRTERD